MATYGKKRVLSPRASRDFDSVLDSTVTPTSPLAAAAAKAKAKAAVSRKISVAEGTAYGRSSSSRTNKLTSSSTTASVVKSPPKFPRSARSSGGYGRGASGGGSSKGSGSSGGSMVSSSSKIGFGFPAASAASTSSEFMSSASSSSSPSSTSSTSSSASSSLSVSGLRSPSLGASRLAAAAAPPTTASKVTGAKASSSAAKVAAAVVTGRRGSPRVSPVKQTNKQTRVSPVKRPRTAGGGGGSYGKRPTVSASVAVVATAAAAVAEAAEVSKLAAAAMARKSKPSLSMSSKSLNKTSVAFGVRAKKMNSSTFKATSTSTASPSSFSFPAASPPSKTPGSGASSTLSLASSSSSPPKVKRTSGATNGKRPAAGSNKTYGSRKTYGSGARKPATVSASSSSASSSTTSSSSSSSASSSSSSSSAAVTASSTAIAAVSSTSSLGSSRARKRARVVRSSARKLGSGGSIDYDSFHSNSGGSSYASSSSSGGGGGGASSGNGGSSGGGDVANDGGVGGVDYCDDNDDGDGNGRSATRVVGAGSARESGRNQQHTDEIEYLLEGLALGQPASVRIPSLLKLGQHAATRDFRQHLQAHGYLSKVFALLADAHGDDLMSIVTSAVIVVLVRDGRSGGLDQDGLTLLTKLFSAKLPLPPSSTGGGSSILARKKRQLRLRQKAHVVEKVKAMLDNAQLQHPFAEISAIDTKALALEAIGSLMKSRGRQLETVQNEIRLSGCLEKLAIAVHDSVETIAATAGLPTKAAFVRLERHLRALNGAVSGNTSNQSYLVCMVDALLLKSLKKLVQLFEEHASLLSHPTPAPRQPQQHPDDPSTPRTVDREHQDRPSTPPAASTSADGAGAGEGNGGGGCVVSPAKSETDIDAVEAALLAAADDADAAARAAGLGSPPKPTRTSPRKKQHVANSNGGGGGANRDVGGGAASSASGVASPLKTTPRKQVLVRKPPLPRPQQPRSDVEELLGECICETFNALLAMTNDNELGCRTFGSRDSLEQVARLAIEHAGKFLKHRHDVTSLGIAVLINLTEHNAENRAALPLATVQYNRAAQPHKASADSAAGAAAGGAGAVDVGDEDRISLLIVLATWFAESSATLEERGVSKDDVGSVQEQTFENIAGAYVAILMGCLCLDNEDNAGVLRSALPGQNFKNVVSHLGDYIYFQQAAGVGQSETGSVQRVMQVLKSADGIQEEDEAD